MSRLCISISPVLCLCAAVIINACSGGSPSPYVGRLDPVAGQWTAYGTGTGIVAHLFNPFAIPTQASGKTVNYVYTTHLPFTVGQTMTLNYSVIGPATFAPIPEAACGAGGCGPANLRLFIWQANDQGGSTYRWWCGPAPLVVGNNQVLSCAIDPVAWTDVNGQQDAAGFAAAIASPYAIGFTFGDEFAGHGVWVTSGTATFKVNSFTVQ